MKSGLFIFLFSLLFTQHFFAGQENERITITGRISDPNGKPVAGALIYILPNLDDSNDQYDIVFSIGESTITDTEGKYIQEFYPNVFREIRTNFFDIYVRNIERNLAAIKKFNKENTVINVTLSPGIILTGRIVDADENPILNASLEFMVPASDSSCKFIFDKDRLVSDKNGNYEIRALWPGKKYTVSVDADGYTLDSIVRYFIDETPDHRIELENMILKVRKKADMSISGTVTDVNGNPKANIIIYSFGYGQPSRDTKTDAQGKFILENICAGPIDLEIVEKDTMFERHMFKFAVVDGHTKEIDIILSGPWWYELQSLVGKSLPELEKLGISLSPSDANDKTILVCFFDKDQRPSRNCILHLSKRAQELKTKNIVIITVQASKVEQAKLDEWIKENNITFPVGMLADDEEKVLSIWGVKSLPWFILTDKEHVVIAEGFTVNELSEKIQDR